MTDTSSLMSRALTQSFRPETNPHEPGRVVWSRRSLAGPPITLATHRLTSSGGDSRESAHGPR